jgi:hypothetical protein
VDSSTESYWFTSSVFEVEPGEDAETNPQLYGRQAARWLRQGFSALGYRVEEVIPEDWGWCVMCQREPYWLWVGCVNLQDHVHAREGDPPPPKDRLLWNVFATAEVPFFKHAFRRKPDVSAGLAKLDKDLQALLKSEPTIQLVDQSVADHWFGTGKNDA